MSWSDVTAALDAIKTLCPSPVSLTLATHDAALRLAVSDGYHVYDALIIAAALEAECITLYSEDCTPARSSTVDSLFEIHSRTEPEPGARRGRGAEEILRRIRAERRTQLVRHAKAERRQVTVRICLE